MSRLLDWAHTWAHCHCPLRTRHVYYEDKPFAFWAPIRPCLVFVLYVRFVTLCTSSRPCAIFSGQKCTYCAYALLDI